MCYPWMVDPASNIRPRYTVVLYTLVLLIANSPIWADGLKLGEVVYGVAMPMGAAPGPALSHMSFEMERCGPIFRTIWRGADDVMVAADELEDASGHRQLGFATADAPEAFSVY